jgi:triphosphatase
LAKSTTPSPDAEYRSTMRSLIGERWVDLWAAVPLAIAGEDPEGVHQVRVASRRLRAAMDVAVDSFPAAWYKPLHKAAKDITSALGEVRDQDVLLEEFTAQRRRIRVAERAGIDHLISTIDNDRVAARMRMNGFLADLDQAGITKETARRFPVSKKYEKRGRKAKK